MVAVVMKVQQVEESALKKVFGGDTDHGSRFFMTGVVMKVQQVEEFAT